MRGEERGKRKKTTGSWGTREQYIWRGNFLGLEKLADVFTSKKTMGIEGGGISKDLRRKAPVSGKGRRRQRTHKVRVRVRPEKTASGVKGACAG